MLLWPPPKGRCTIRRVQPQTRFLTVASLCDATSGPSLFGRVVNARKNRPDAAIPFSWELCWLLNLPSEQIKSKTLLRAPFWSNFLDRVSQCGINKVHLIYSMLCKSPVCRLLNLEYNGSLSVYLLLYVCIYSISIFSVWRPWNHAHGSFQCLHALAAHFICSFPFDFWFFNFFFAPCSFQSFVSWETGDAADRRVVVKSHKVQTRSLLAERFSVSMLFLDVIWMGNSIKHPKGILPPL